jgi:hypothetical protein
VFDLSLSFLAVMADPVSLTTSPVHSEVFDLNRRSCGELLVCLNRDFWRWNTVFFYYFFLSKIKQKGTTICDNTLIKEKMNILKLYWSV